MSSNSSMTGSEKFSRTQYQEALQFLLSQPTIRTIESSVLSTASVINSGLSASLVTVMPDLIPHQEFDFRSINTGVQIESGITDIQSSPLLENLDSYTTLAATNTRSKTLKRDSALRDEERLCLLLQTQQQISALDEQVMEFIVTTTVVGDRGRHEVSKFDECFAVALSAESSFCTLATINDPTLIASVSI